MANDIQITGAMQPGFETILTEPALAFVAQLHRMYEPTRQSLLAARQSHQRWWDAGGASTHMSVLGKPGFEKSASYAPVYLDSMKIVKDFWAEPTYAQLLLAMQNRVHNYVVAGKGTPQEALDGLLKDWTEIFKEDGKLK